MVANTEEWTWQLPDELRPLVSLELTTPDTITKHLSRSTDGRYWLVEWDSMRCAYRWWEILEPQAGRLAEPVAEYCGLAAAQWRELFNPIEKRSGAVRQKADSKPDQDLDDDLDDEPITPAKLADRLGIPADDKKARDALRKRLEHWRDNNCAGGWIEVADPKPRQPRYLYPLRTVWPIVKDMKRSG